MFFIVNLIIIIAAIPFWEIVYFDKRLFWVGFIGSMFDQIGYICVQNAFHLGPAGPVAAIYGIANYTFVVIECIKNAKMLSLAESIGLIIVIYGAFLIIFPEFYYKYCFCICIRKRK